MPKKLKWMLSGILLGSLINGCAPQPPDVFVFESLEQHLTTDSMTGHTVLSPSPACMTQIQEPACGHGVSIMTGREIFVGEGPLHLMNNKPWSVLKSQSVYLPATESYAPLATYVINACEKMGCNDQVAKFKVKLDSLASIKNMK